jgi:hypothetical protein
LAAGAAGSPGAAGSQRDGSVRAGSERRRPAAGASVHSGTTGGPVVSGTVIEGSLVDEPIAAKAGAAADPAAADPGVRDAGATEPAGRREAPIPTQVRPTTDPNTRSRAESAGAVVNAERQDADEYAEGEYDEDDPPGEPPPQLVGPADAALVATMVATVLVVDGRPRYHRAGCGHLRGRPTEPLPVREAVELGFTPCGRCEPDSALIAGARAS